MPQLEGFVNTQVRHHYFVHMSALLNAHRLKSNFIERLSVTYTSWMLCLLRIMYFLCVI